MTKETLIKEVAKILGVSLSERELAFEIFTTKLAGTLSFDEAIKIRDMGVFQLRGDHTKRPDGGYSNNFGEEVEEILVFTPMTDNTFEKEEIDFIIIDFKRQFKRSLDFEEVFSPGFGKPIIPLTTDTDLTNNVDASYLLLKKSIEERVNEILAESERLENFNLLDDHFKAKSGIKDKSKLTIMDELTSDMEKFADGLSNNFDDEEKPEVETTMPDEQTEDETLIDDSLDDNIPSENKNEIDAEDDWLRRAKLITEEEDFVRTPEKEGSIEEEFGIKKIDDNIEEELINWNWGDGLIDEYEPETGDVDENEIEQQDEDEFTTLANGIAEPTTQEIFEKVMDKDIPAVRDKRPSIPQQGFVKNFVIIFSSLLFIIVIILWLFDNDDSHIALSADPNESTQVISKEDPEGVITQSPSDVIDDISTELDSDPIQERTNQMLGNNQTPDKNLYRSFTSEQNVGGLVFYGGSYYYVQTSSWRESAKAEREVRRLRSLGFDAFVVKAYIPKYNSNWYRVRIGNFASKREAETFLRNNKF